MWYLIVAARRYCSSGSSRNTISSRVGYNSSSSSCSSRNTISISKIVVVAVVVETLNSIQN